MITRILLALAMALPAAALAQATLTVEITLNRPDAGGVLRVALCSSREAFDKEQGCVLAEATAKGPVVQVRFTGVAFGEHALKVFHDVDGNGKLDTNWMGIPKEPYGFSNDAMGTFGPPSWEQAKFTVGGERTVTRLKTKG
jgi:uncharacterized protein (DUF2141 family)